jgi:hypothetical protein
MKPMTDLLAAVQWPPTRFAIPQLWDRARTMFKAVFHIIGTTAALATWWKVPADMRSGLLCRLVPIEKIARLLITVEAITFLIMTPEGRRLMRETPAMAVPDPRARLSLQSSGPAAERAAPTELPYIPPTAPPSEWACQFNVLGWKVPRPENPEDPEEPAAQASESLGQPAASAAPRGLTREPARRLARRVEALTRVLADPGPAILRVAKFLAGAPRGALAPPDPGAVPSRWWWHGRPEWFNACTVAERPHILFEQLIEPG